MICKNNPSPACHALVFTPTPLNNKPATSLVPHHPHAIILHPIILHPFFDAP